MVTLGDRLMGMGEKKRGRELRGSGQGEGRLALNPRRSGGWQGEERSGIGCERSSGSEARDSRGKTASRARDGGVSPQG